MRALWLADVLRAAGCDVIELAGWQTRGRELDIAYGVVVHDTVTPDTWTDESVDSLLVNGRPDVPGPLSQLGLDRQGRFRVVASGRANHAGYSSPWGNSSIGIEVYCAGGLAGREEPWNDAQYEAAVVGARAILERLGHGPSDHYNPRVAGHKEIDTRGKIDPYLIDMDQLRRDVAGPRPEGPPVTRLAGADRYATAAALARTRFGDRRWDSVVLVRDGSPDGQTAPQLDAPLLLVSDVLPEATADALRRHRPREILIVGGEAVVSKAVERAARTAAA